jgi:hypothetical protein
MHIHGVNFALGYFPTISEMVRWVGKRWAKTDCVRYPAWHRRQKG